MHDILAFANSYRHWTRGVQYAAELAALLDASLTGIYASEPIPVAGLPSVLPEFYTLTRDIANEAMQEEASFLNWAHGLGVKRGCWQVVEGYVADVLAEAANWNDVLVLESGRHSVWGSPGVVGKILLTCGAPCIVVPEGYSQTARPDRIAIAWNGSAESMRAVHAALPLLKRAGHVVLIHGERDGIFSSVTWSPPLKIETYLSQHGISFTTHLFDASGESAGGELLAVARENAADLLVMGAFGHARFSEWVLGGATLHVLECATIPVLMRH